MEGRRKRILEIFEKIHDKNSFSVDYSDLPFQTDIVFEDGHDDFDEYYNLEDSTDLRDPSVLNKDLYLQALNQPPVGWKETFKRSIQAIYESTQYVKKFKDGLFYPEHHNVYRCFWEVPLDKVKVVIVGQDPYHTIIGDSVRATGLSFSQNRSDNVSVSLKNIYKEIKSSYPSFKIPKHGDISEWCKQGILLLNMCLTVYPGISGSHGDTWISFIKNVIEDIVNKNRDVIFVLWGKKAESLSPIIGNKVAKIVSAHPSGLSANRGFFGSNFAKRVNEHLESKNMEPIDWSIV